MIDYETYVRIRNYFENDSLKYSQIAHALDLDCRTVARWANEKRYQPRKSTPRKSKLDPFVNEIVRMIKIAPNSPAEIVHRQLVELGFDGGVTIVRDYLRKIRGELYGNLYLGDVGHFWMLRLLQGKVTCNELEETFKGQLNSIDILRLHNAILNKSLRYRNRSITVLSYLNNISQRSIARFLFLSRITVSQYIIQFTAGGVEKLFDFTRKEQKKSEDPKYVKSLFKVLHTPPSTYDINRTTWKMDDIHRVMKNEGLLLSRDNIRKIIKNAGYKFLKAKKVLTSNDPEYRKKINKIKNILSILGPKEKFFSVDEFGPFAIKMQGGRSLVAPGQINTVPQRQKSKGTLIVTAALELSTNQITHFYSKRKNTSEMIKLLNILIDKYLDEETIYFSWDAASWHASKELYKTVDRINSKEFKDKKASPIVKLAPLPTGAQFLNVIESVFSGLAKAIIHNSNYQSVDECKYAINRYFAERNEKFIKNPKRAGKKIWRKERVKAVFDESNNCKDPKFR